MVSLPTYDNLHYSHHHYPIFCHSPLVCAWFVLGSCLISPFLLILLLSSIVSFRSVFFPFLPHPPHFRFSFCVIVFIYRSDSLPRITVRAVIIHDQEICAFLVCHTLGHCLLKLIQIVLSFLGP